MMPAFVDQDVSTPEPLSHPLGGRDDAVAIGHVGLDRHAAVAQLAGQRRDAVKTACEESDPVAV
jgi:hypothetical protein